MIWQLNPPTFLLFLAGFLNLILVINIWPKRHTHLGLTAIVLTAAVSLWSSSEFIKLGLQTDGVSTLLLGLNFIGIGAAPSTFLIFTLLYTGRSHWVTKPRVMLLIALNSWQPFAVWTTARHGLFFSNLAEDVISRGPLFYLHTIISYLILTSSIVILLTLLRHDRKYRRNILTLLSAVTIPVIYNALFVLRVPLAGQFDLTPVAFTISILILLSSVFRGNILDFLPIAYREIFHNLNDPIIVVNQYDQILDMNLAAQKIASRPLNDCLQQSLEIGFPPLESAITLHQPPFFPHSEVHWNDQKTIYNLRITPLRDQRDTLRGRIILLNDITEQKEAEQMLREQYKTVQELAQKHQSALLDADLANQTKDNFLANMSHELRTPLNAILGYTELVVDEATDYDYRDILPDLHKIQSSGHHLHDIITRILTLTKIRNQKFSLYSEFFPIIALLEELRHEAEGLFQRQKNRFEITYNSNLPDIYADERQVYNILLNLLNNGSKFTHNGRIDLHIDSEQIDNQTWVVCRVSDTGIGIPPHKLNTIFQAFAQGDNSHTKAYEGIGIGLTISRQLCELMNGFLKIDSVENEGTTVQVYLPTHAPASTAVESVDEMLTTHLV